MANKWLTEFDWEIVLALADNNMNESKTAQGVYLSRNAVMNRLMKFKRILGLDPTNFYDLGKLVRLAKNRRNKDG